MTAGLIGHQCHVTWRGSCYLTLSPIWPAEPRAVIVGINPAPPSVTAGHYYQGPFGQKALKRLTCAGVVTEPRADMAFDDHASDLGIAFTDLVPRPTYRASDLCSCELRAGADRLGRELEERQPRLIICVFKPPVEALLGKQAGPPGRQQQCFADIPVFRLAGPFAPRDSALRNVSELREVWQGVTS